MTRVSYRMFVIGLPLLFLLFYLFPHIYNITTGKEANRQVLIRGSHLNAGNAINVDTQELNIQASRDTAASSSNTKSVHANVTFSTAGVMGGGIGGGMSKDRSRSSTYNNSSLSADTINLASSKDTNIQGANIHGAKATNLNVGGNLNVASLQDRHTEKSVGVDVSLSYVKDDDPHAPSNEVGTVGKTTFSVASAGTGKGSSSKGSLNAHASRGNYQAVTNQTSITGGRVTINTQGNTHLKGALIKGEEATSITTATLTAEDIQNRADYNSMSGGVSYASSTTSSEKPEANNNHSKKPEEQRAKGLTPNIGLPQEVEKSSTTHTAIADNTVINITDQANQTQDTDKISRDTEHASYAMTEINTEVLNIRADISKEVSKDGFKAVGDLAMEEDWEDGSIEKTLAHAAMGAVVAGIGNGDALSGAVGAGAAEAARPATKDADDATQQTVSAVVGAIAGGGTGASTGLDGEKYNRQLHQREIAWIKEHAEAFAQELYGENPTPEQLADAKARLAQQALRGVDKGWSLKLGSKDDESAKSFLDQNNAHLFTVKNAYEFKDGSTDGEHEISSLDQEAFGTLASFYQTNINRATSSNPDGTLRNANEAWANEKDMIDALKEGKIGLDEFNQALRDFIPNAAESIAQIPDAAHSAGNYLDAVLPTTNQERLDILYGSHTDGSVLQANLSTADAISTMGMATGAGMAAHGIVRAGGRALNGAVDEALEINAIPRVDAIDADLGRGPNGGKGTLTEYNTADGKPIIQRESGEYYTYDDNGNQVRVNSPSTHGNTLNDTPAECYGLYCRDTGEVKKYGETIHGEDRYGAGNQQRYSDDYLIKHNVDYKPIETGTKVDMHQLQHELIEEHKANNDGKRPDLNKNDY